MKEVENPGKTTIAADVLITIAKMTCLSVPGVSRMSPVPPGVSHLFKRGLDDGVEITVENNAVYIELYVVLNRDVNVREVSRAIQSQVTRAISEMVDMEIGKIDIHIEDIDYSSHQEQA